MEQHRKKTLSVLSHFTTLHFISPALLGCLPLGKNMKVIILIGRKRTGKTTFTCELINKLARPKQLIFDVNNEYTRKLGVRNDYTGPLEHDFFLDAALKEKNALIVCEEAATYLSNRGREEKLLKLMQESRHTNNSIIIILHSIQDLPPYIYNRSDYLGLFKTQDFPGAIDRKFKFNRQFMEAYTRVEASENPHEVVFYPII